MKLENEKIRTKLMSVLYNQSALISLSNIFKILSLCSESSLAGILPLVQIQLIYRKLFETFFSGKVVCTVDRQKIVKALGLSK